jgi:hypothetical protein
MIIMFRHLLDCCQQLWPPPLAATPAAAPCVLFEILLSSSTNSRPALSLWWGNHQQRVGRKTEVKWNKDADKQNGTS